MEPLKWRATHLRGGKIKSVVISSSWKLEVCFAGRVSGGEETVEPPELTAETHCWKLPTHTTKVFAEHTNFTPLRLLSSPLSLSGNLTSDTAAAAAAAASSSSVHLRYIPGLWCFFLSLSVRGCAAVVSSSTARSVDFGTWNTGLEMFSELRCQTPPLQQCIYCSLPCYCTPQPQHTHTHTHTHSNTAPTQLAGWLLSLRGAGGVCSLQPHNNA